MPVSTYTFSVISTGYCRKRKYYAVSPMEYWIQYIIQYVFMSEILLMSFLSLNNTLTAPTALFSIRYLRMEYFRLLIRSPRKQRYSFSFPITLATMRFRSRIDIGILRTYSSAIQLVAEPQIPTQQPHAYHKYHDIQTASLTLSYRLVLGWH